MGVLRGRGPRNRPDTMGNINGYATSDDKLLVDFAVSRSLRNTFLNDRLLSLLLVGYTEHK